MMTTIQIPEYDDGLRPEIRQKNPTSTVIPPIAPYNHGFGDHRAFGNGCGVSHRLRRYASPPSASAMGKACVKAAISDIP